MRRRLLEALAVASVMIALIVFLRLSVAGQAAAPQSAPTLSPSNPLPVTLNQFGLRFGARPVSARSPTK